MAQKVIIVDDVDGYEGQDVVRRDFEVGGVMYTVDLGDANFKRLQDLLGGLAPFLASARQVRPAGRARQGAGAGWRLQGYTNSDVRAWARGAGVEVSVRGKIADEVYEQFVAAHPDARPQD